MKRVMIFIFIFFYELTDFNWKKNLCVQRIIINNKNKIDQNLLTKLLECHKYTIKNRIIIFFPHTSLPRIFMRLLSLCRVWEVGPFGHCDFKYFTLKL